MAFTLYDTYGFQLISPNSWPKKKDLKVDTEGFDKHMEEAKNIARAAHKSHSFSSSDKHLSEWTQKLSQLHGPTDFVGYEQLTLDTEIIAVSDGEKEVSSLKVKVDYYQSHSFLC